MLQVDEDGGYYLVGVNSFVFSVTDDDEDSDDYQMTIFETDDFDTAIKFMGAK